MFDVKLAIVMMKCAEWHVICICQTLSFDILRTILMLKYKEKTRFIFELSNFDPNFENEKIYHLIFSMLL